MKKGLSILILVVISIALFSLTVKAFSGFPNGTVDVLVLDYQNNTYEVIRDWDGYSNLGLTYPKRSGYEIVSWSGYGIYDWEQIAEDNRQEEYQIVLQHIWTYRGYSTVYFRDYDNTILKTESVLFSDDATPPSDPSRDGYIFTGWSGDYTDVNEAARDIYATYTSNYFQITYLDYDSTTLKTEYVAQYGSLNPPSFPTRTGYTFIGWSPSLASVTANATYTAQYTLNYKITFDSNGGTPVFANKTYYGETYKLISSQYRPIREGYSFEGWWADWTTGTDAIWDFDDYLLQSNATFTAQWASLDNWVDYNDGYEDGYNAGLDVGKGLGYEDGSQESEDYWITYLYTNGFINTIYNDENSYSYRLGRQSVSTEEMAITDFIPGLVGVFFGFFFQLASISVLGISLLDILALIFSFGILIIIIKIFVTKG